MIASTLVFLTQLVQAGNGVNADALKYNDWIMSRPNAVTFVSNQVVRNAPWLSPGIYRWQDRERNPVAAQEAILCAVARPGLEIECAERQRSGRAFIDESYLGSAAQFTPSLLSDSSSIGRDDLAILPPGAIRVLVVNIVSPGQPRVQVATIAYEEISDDALRQLALEEGVYRALRWRDD